MKNVLIPILVLASLALGNTNLLAQDYPFWLRDIPQQFDEYPTSVASTDPYTATAGLYVDDYETYDQSYSPFYNVPCFVCNPFVSAFVTLREETSAFTWTASIYPATPFTEINNRVDIQSVPQVDVASTGEVYVSLTFRGIIELQDAVGAVVTIPAIGGNYDFVVIKFDQMGNYIWHIIEGSPSNDFITDLDYNENNQQLAITGYVEGAGPSLILGNGVLTAFPIPPLSNPSVLGANWGNAFAGVYEDLGPFTNPLWAREVAELSYSHDVVIEDGAHVFMSGYQFSTAVLAGQPISGAYVCSGIDEQYFLVGFDPGAGTMWAESYGSRNNELSLVPELRGSSLAINPATAELYFAFFNTGDICGTFPDYGTVVNQIDPGSGTIMASAAVGNTFNTIFSWDFLVNPWGSPTYNPNIIADDNNQVYISGNFLLASSPTPTGIHAAYEEMEIGGTYVNHGATAAGSAGYNEVVGWYTAMMDFNAGGVVYDENVNVSYVPFSMANAYRKLPAYGIAQDFGNGWFYSVLGFEEGQIELDLTPSGGPFNNYSNLSGTAHFDGLVVRSQIGGGF